MLVDLVVASAGDDKKITLWNKNGQSMGSIPPSGHDLADDIEIIATVGLDKKLYMFDSGTKRPTSCMPFEAPFSSVAYNDDGNILAAGTNNGRVVFYDVRGKPQPFTVLRAYNSSEVSGLISWDWHLLIEDWYIWYSMVPWCIICRYAQYTLYRQLNDTLLLPPQHYQLKVTHHVGEEKGKTTKSAASGDQRKMSSNPGEWLFDYGGIVGGDSYASDFLWDARVIDDPSASSTMLGFGVLHNGDNRPLKK
ncbi:hypothetical protein GW17_00012754, partial [Ensete ventricosum]